MSRITRPCQGRASVDPTATAGSDEAIDELMATAVILQILIAESEYHPAGLVLMRREAVVGILDRVLKALELLGAEI